MPKKYVIHTKAAPPRFKPIGKLGIVDWREDCSNCHNCVKKGCVYDLYREENRMLHDETGFLDYIYQCNGCLVCIQDCTKNILTRIVNPEYNMLGDEYYNPDIILSTWYQAETGRIPVSGAGYGGKFTGDGFNSMWTDMSEIVRPTRDGIHGREYINTSVDIGRKLNHLSFEKGELLNSLPPRIESPMPLVFDIIPDNFQRGVVLTSICESAQALGLYTIVQSNNIDKNIIKNKNIFPLINSANEKEIEKYQDRDLIVLPYSKNILKLINKIKIRNNKQIIAVRIEATSGAKEDIIDLAKNGVEVINLVFNKHGMESSREHPRHMRYVLRDIHLALVNKCIRDEVTLIASGGIALPEYMAKAIICGADLVTIDLSLLIALECRLCLECMNEERCQIRLEEIEKEYAKKRIINLIAAWRNQLLEMLGAMGIREVVRLRGETGRCMFFEDLEKETFEPIFGKRIK